MPPHHCPVLLAASEGLKWLSYAHTYDSKEYISLWTPGVGPCRIILFQAEIKRNLGLICATVAHSTNRSHQGCPLSTSYQTQKKRCVCLFFFKKDGRRAFLVQAAALYNMNCSAKGN